MSISLEKLDIANNTTILENAFDMIDNNFSAVESEVNSLSSDINSLKTGSTIKTDLDISIAKAEYFITSHPDLSDLEAREEVFIGNTEPTKDGIWFDTSDQPTETELPENSIVTEIKSYINNGVQGEVITARGTYANLDSRLDNTDTQLSEKAKQIDLNTTNTNMSNHLADLITDSDGVHGLKIEDGVFTPTLTDSGTTGPTSVSINNGYYHKIGSTVSFNIAIKINVKGSAMTNTVVHIGMLPFVGKTNTNRYYPVIVHYSELVNSGSGKTVTGLIGGGQNWITLKLCPNDGTVMQDLLTSTLTDGSFFMVSGQYQV